MSDDKQESYYEILKVDSSATTAEIVAAYHKAKNAFSKDSLATYTLFEPSDVAPILEKLEQAYQSLTNPQLRTAYDQQRLRQKQPTELPLPITELARKDRIRLTGSDSLEPKAVPVPLKESLPIEPIHLDQVNGAKLRSVREKRGLSIDDVARVTRIPKQHIKAIEEDQFKKLPVRVYVQGYIKNLAQLYKLDPKSTSQKYLGHWDEIHPPSHKDD